MLDLRARLLALFRQTKAVRIQYVSDLHLEALGLYDTFPLPPSAPYLVPAGDIGRLSSYDRLLSFLQRVSANFDHVFLVLGNHEYYGLDQHMCLLWARSLAAEESLMGKVTLLNRTRVDINERVTILGRTLWSHMPDHARDTIQVRVNDFKGRIAGWTVERHNAEHAVDVAWLKGEIERVHRAEPNRRIAVVTHHAPSLLGTSSPKDSVGMLTAAFASDILENQFVKWPGHTMVSHRIFGHTHHCCDLRCQNVRLVANQHGYFPLSNSQGQ